MPYTERCGGAVERYDDRQLLCGVERIWYGVPGHAQETHALVDTPVCVIFYDLRCWFACVCINASTDDRELTRLI